MVIFFFKNIKKHFTIIQDHFKDYKDYNFFCNTNLVSMCR